MAAVHLRDLKRINATYDHINHICLIMVERSMWFAKSYEALAENDLECLIRKNQNLADKTVEVRLPLVFAFSYAQRVFLCSAMELCLMHQHSNSVFLLDNLWPSRLTRLEHLLEQMKKMRKEDKIRSWSEWGLLDWDRRKELLRKLSFSSLRSAASLFDDIYGPDCFDLAWGKVGHERLASQYETYQTLRNGILHRGGELSSGTCIEATDADIATTLEDAERFREAIHQLSDWCRAWWIEQLAKSKPEAIQNSPF